MGNNNSKNGNDEQPYESEQLNLLDDRDRSLARAGIFSFQLVPVTFRASKLSSAIVIVKREPEQCRYMTSSLKMTYSGNHMLIRVMKDTT
jgi:hypothetical protein